MTPRAETGLFRWTPWEELADNRRRMDPLYSRFFGYAPLPQLIPGTDLKFELPIDIFITDDKVVAGRSERSMVHLLLTGVKSKRRGSVGARRDGRRLS